MRSSAENQKTHRASAAQTLLVFHMPEDTLELASDSQQSTSTPHRFDRVADGPPVRVALLAVPARVVDTHKSEDGETCLKCDNRP